MNIPLQIEIVPFSSRSDEIRRIRHAVFVDELKIPAALEFDDHDEAADHVLATTDQQAIGTGRLLRDGHIGRIAVLAHWRRQGIGTAMLNELIQLANHKKLPSVFLSAQLESVGFYKKLGFHPVGETFMAAGIVHRNMEKNLQRDMIKNGTR